MDYSIFSIKDHVVAVTGGCGGIGSGIAEGLAALGAKVAILDRDTDKVGSVADAIAEKTGSEVRGYAADITDEESVRDAFRKIFEDFGSVDGLINCAGITHVAPLSEMPMDRWQAVMDVNLKGTVICSKVAGKYMYESGGGSIVNISSLAATHGKPGYTAYTPSKAAVNGFTFTLATEWARLGINVNSISPVMVVTAINRDKIESDPTYLDNVLSTIPNGKLCSAEMLVGPITFLLSEAGSYVTGQNIGCDGGCQNGDIAVIKPFTSM